MDKLKDTSIKGDFASRLAALPAHYQNLYKGLVDYHGIDFQNPESVNSYIANIDKSLGEELGQRPGAESSMRFNRNSVENLFNYLNLGRDLPPGVGQLPGYKLTPGYR